MNELLKFEGQEVKVKTDKGETLINLVSTAKSCGLVRSGNTGLPKIRWDDIKKKLNLILKSVRDESSTPSIKIEINYILDEIENTDDRNTIYMSTWLSKRLALECHSDRAMRYKNFLVTLDEKRETGALMTTGQLAPHVYQLAQETQVLGQVMQAAMVQMQEYVQDSIQAKDHQIEQAMELIGLRSINVRRLSDKLKEKLSKEFGVNIKTSNEHYRKAKKKVFKEFNVTKWEDISVSKYNAVYAFIDEMIEV